MWSKVAAKSATSASASVARRRRRRSRPRRRAIGVRRSAITCATSLRPPASRPAPSAAASGTGPPQTCAIERCGCRRWTQGQSGSGGPGREGRRRDDETEQQAADHWFPPLRPRQRPLAGSYMKIVAPKKTSGAADDHREGERVELDVEREADQLDRVGERVGGADVVQEHARVPHPPQRIERRRGEEHREDHEVHHPGEVLELPDRRRDQQPDRAEHDPGEDQRRQHRRHSPRAAARPPRTRR